MLTYPMAARMSLQSVRPAVRVFCSLLLFALSPLASASTSTSTSTVKVGDVTLEVPTSPGYARVTPEMKELLARIETVTAPHNVSLALYIPEQDIPQALAGVLVESQRIRAVQAPKDTLDRQFTQEYFADMKVGMRMQQAQVIEKLKRDMPEMMNKTLDKVSDASQNARVNPGGVETLLSHYEDANSFASSIVARIEYNAGGNQPAVSVVTATMTLVLVKGKLIFLYVYGNEDDLEWTREQSKEWTKALVAANQPLLKKP
jgi:hypothetical protein